MMAVALMLFTPFAVRAQRVAPAVVIKVVPTQMMKDGRLYSCGLDIWIVTAGLAAGAYDITTVSMNGFSFTPQHIVGVVAFNAASVQEWPSGRPVSSGKIESAWVRVAQGDALPLGALTQEPDDKAVANDLPLGRGEMSKIVMAMTTIIERGARIQAGIRLRGAPVEVIYSGIPLMAVQDKLSASACIKELIDRLASTRAN